MTEVPHQPCPYPLCGSSDAFSWNTDGYGKCHSCGEHYPSNRATYDWAQEKYPTKKRVDVEDIEIATSTYGSEDNKIRGISPDVCKTYGIQLQMDEAGNPVRYAFRHPAGIKYREYAAPPGAKKKKFWAKDPGTKFDVLFGPEFNSGTANRIYITEGEFDAASLYEILDKQYPVMSLPSASIGPKFMQNTHDFLSPFKEIVYAGELDKAGKPTADKLYQAYPEKLWFVPMTKHKDANAFLMAGDREDLKWAARKPQRYAPDNFFISDQDAEKAIREENPYEVVSTGHSALDDKMRGWVKGGVTFIKAPRGTGKTEICRWLERNILQNSETSIVAALHAEEMKSTTYRAMASYELGTNVRTKLDAEQNNITEDQVVEAALKAKKGERTILFEMRSADEPLDILDYIRMAAAIYGAEYIVIDHIQRLAYLSKQGVDGATAALTALGAQLAQLAKELNIGIICVSQVNDDGRTKYASALEEEAIICIKLDRDLESEDEVVQNTTFFVLDKNRPFAKVGKAGAVYYNRHTTIIEESYE